MRLENAKYSYDDMVFSVLYSITILPVVYKLDDALPIIQIYFTPPQLELFQTRRLSDSSIRAIRDKS